jgi:hypothetical protein
MQVRGYRSALFGMTEEQVRVAAARDFGVPPGKPAPGPISEEGSRTLVLTVSSLEPVDRTGIVSYVFDKANGRLIAVNLLWSGGETADLADVKQMVAAASSITAELLGHSWAPLSEVRGVPVDPQTLIVFGATDEAGGGIEVRLQNIPYQLEGGLSAAPAAAGPPIMRLGFVTRARRPDLELFSSTPAQPSTAELSR